MPDLPPRVRLGRHVWRLIVDDTGRISDDGYRGATHAERLEIVVDGQLPTSLLRETVAHELLHALWEMAELRTEGLDEPQVERIVSHLAPVLVELLDNRELVAWLTERP